MKKPCDKAHPTDLESPATRDPVTIPFFTIGVATYNRPELLKQTLASITQQTFTDFEVIVGNDYIAEPLSAEKLGINDPRIHFVNYSQNLGEVKNLNTLLSLARSRYFTWQTDDDLYAPNFLEEVHLALTKFKFPLCVYTAFEYIREPSWPDPVKTLSGQGQSHSGRQFLRMYWAGMWAGRAKAMGCTGVYDREYLKRLGGVEALSDTSFALYSEHLLLFRACLLKQVAYIDEPLVKFRVHDGSWGKSTAKSPRLCKQAGKALVRNSVVIFTRPELQDDFRQNIDSVLRFVIRETLWNLQDQNPKRSVSPLEVLPYLFSLRKQFDSLIGTVFYWKAVYSLGRFGMKLIKRGMAGYSLRTMIGSCARVVRRVQFPLGRDR